jgi:chaperone modulatory protein CbpM
MIPLSRVCQEVPGVTEDDLRRWLAQDWVRPDREAGEPAFREIDIARIRLIRELHVELQVEEPTVPIVLGLLDQLYSTRHQLRLVLEKLDARARQTLAEALAELP